MPHDDHAEVKTKFYKGTNRTATYTYYRCTRKSKVIPCRESFIREEELDRQLSNLLQTVSLRSDWAAKMLHKLDEEKNDAAHSSRACVADKQQDITAITTKLQRLWIPISIRMLTVMTIVPAKRNCYPTKDAGGVVHPSATHANCVARTHACMG